MRERERGEFSKLETTRDTGFSRSIGGERERKKEMFKGKIVGERTEGSVEKAITRRLREEEEEGCLPVLVSVERSKSEKSCGKRGEDGRPAISSHNRDFSRPIVSRYIPGSPSVHTSVQLSSLIFLRLSTNYATPRLIYLALPPSLMFVR